MSNPIRTLATLVGAAGATCVAAAAENGMVRSSAADREIAALLAETQRRWSVSASVDVGAGYRDNLLLDHDEEARSGFTRGAAEVVLLRLPTGAFEYNLFGLAERTEYWRQDVVNDEWQAWLRMEPACRVGTWRFALPVIGYYNKQVLDYSITAGKREVGALRVRGGMVTPMVRWSFLPSWWLEAQATGDRKRYEDGVNDATMGEGAVRLGWIHGERLEANVAGKQRWRNFDRRERYSAAGRPVPDSERKISEREIELSIDVAWDAAERWTTSTQASLLHYRDNGSGYFNYREQRIAHELEWTGAAWMVRIGGAASRLDFGVQTVGGGLRPQARFIDDYSAEVRVERKLNERWTIFAAYEWERNRSNDRLAAYRVNEGLLGVRWGWEK